MQTKTNTLNKKDVIEKLLQFDIGDYCTDKVLAIKKAKYKTLSLEKLQKDLKKRKEQEYIDTLVTLENHLADNRINERQYDNGIETLKTFYNEEN